MAPILFLRSFGDFTIAISVLEQVAPEKRPPCMASKHLEPLYTNLIAYRPQAALHIRFVDLGIRRKILGFFTNKHLFSLDSLREARSLKSLLHSVETIEQPVFEQYRRLWLLRFWIGDGWRAVHHSGNVYDSYCRRLGVDNHSLVFACERLVRPRKILILPESRKPSKAFSQSFIHELVKKIEEEGHQVMIAFYGRVPSSFNGKASTHQSFMDLIRLVDQYDFIVTADSLPAHLAQLMRKPHFVFYSGKPNPEWITPFCSQHGSFDSMKKLQKLMGFL